MNSTNLYPYPSLYTLPAPFLSSGTAAPASSSPSSLPFTDNSRNAVTPQPPSTLCYSTVSVSPAPRCRTYRFSLWILSESCPFLSSFELLCALTCLPVVVDGIQCELTRLCMPGDRTWLPWMRAWLDDFGKWSSHPVLDSQGHVCTQEWTVFSYAVDLPEPLSPWGSYIALRRESPIFLAINSFIHLDKVNLVQVRGSCLVPVGEHATVWTSTSGMHNSEGEPLRPQVGTHFLSVDLVDGHGR